MLLYEKLICALDTPYFSVKTLINQVLYQTNIDYEATYQKLLKSSLVIADITQKGLLWFKFKETGTHFLVSHDGRLQVKWNSPSEKEMVLNKLKPLLVPKENGELRITPIMQQLVVYYSQPSIKVYWCERSCDYFKSGCDPLIWTLAPLATGLFILLASTAFVKG